LVLCFLTGSLYVLDTLYKSKNDYLLFFLGAKKDSLLKNEHKQ